MKKLFISFVLCMSVIDAIFAEARDPRVGIKASRFGPAVALSNSVNPSQDRAIVASKNQLTTPDVSVSTDRSPSIKADDVKVTLPQKTEEEKDRRDTERAACMNNNIGIGNTFVWASRYSNPGNYATMQEDVDNPENNVCFVKVDIKSSDSRVDTSDIQSRYFQWGDIINCGGWVEEDMLKQRILDAKKKGRTWATVGGAVGGAAVGVGAMELFGNRLIGGKVEGQKNQKLSSTDVLRSQLLTLKKKQDSRYDDVMTSLRRLKENCDALKKVGGASEHCEEFNFDVLLNS